MSDLFERLAAPFPADAVSWRVGSSNKKKLQRETGKQDVKATKGQALAYIDARDVMDRFDAVCGPGGWQNRYSHADRKTICEIGVRSPDGEWIWKADGAGDSDIEAEKGSLSDSFKRAAVRWGVGRYLYHLPSPWVDLDEREQIKDADRRKLEGILRGHGAPASAPSEPPPPSMAEKAINVLRGCSSDKGLLQETWERHREAWKKAMNGPDYAAVVAETKRLVAAFPKDEPTPPPADDFGLNGDNVPTFN
ncbi:Rad52/Rad22 family DNA repair protein [Phenylobacterium sp.]|uniref:Rad52/Rad22 family DNA repair protein n=1 Tax=Phenylobacterium sp. TaxID=1871053 RepID=UPI002621A304|nr:Rad52/Rad22 family DNA repair protein [Phenylobacterium sp.]